MAGPDALRNTGITERRLPFSQGQDGYRQIVRHFMDKHVEPALRSYDLTRPLTRADVRALAKQLRVEDIAINEPKLADGSPDLIAISIFVEELHRIDASVANIMSALFFSPMPLKEMLDARQLEVYRRLFTPGTMLAVGFSEPGIGSDAAGVQTTAHRAANGDWLINGRKLWTSNATIADAIFVGCRVPEEDGGLSLFLVDRASYPYTPKPIPCLGFTGISTCEVQFENCRVPASARIGEPGSGLRIFLKFQDRARLTVAMGAVGIAQAALDAAVHYIAISAPELASSQLVQQLIVDMAIDIDAGRLLALNATAMVQAGVPARVEVSMAKIFCTEMTVRVASNGIQIHGVAGLAKKGRPARYLRDARMYTIPDGTSQIHKLIIGKQLLGVSALA